MRRRRKEGKQEKRDGKRADIGRAKCPCFTAKSGAKHGKEQENNKTNANQIHYHEQNFLDLALARSSRIYLSEPLTIDKYERFGQEQVDLIGTAESVPTAVGGRLRTFSLRLFISVIATRWAREGQRKINVEE
jgi:hypothetical protein